MGFWTQFKLLLWKNYILRKRQKLRLLIEIVWPLTLFLILMWVRTRGLKENVKECVFYLKGHFEARALPSAGFVPFLRSFYCAFSNPCHSFAKEQTSRPSGLETFNSSRLIIELEQLLKNNFLGGELENFDLVGRDLGMMIGFVTNETVTNKSFKGNVLLRNVLSNIPIQELESLGLNLSPDLTEEILETRISASLFQKSSLKMTDFKFSNVFKFLVHKKLISKVLLDGRFRSLNELFCDEQLYHEVVIPRSESLSEEIRLALCNKSSKELSEILNVLSRSVDGASLAREVSDLVELNTGRKISVEAWMRIGNLLTNLIPSAWNLEDVRSMRVTVAASGLRGFDELTSDPMGTVYHWLCGRNLSDLFDSLFKQDTVLHLDDLTNRFHLDRWEVQSMDDGTNATFVAECKDMLEVFRQDKIIQVIWRQLKPFLLGRILYTPSVNVTDRIMSKVNEKFGIVSALLNVTNEWLNNISPGLRKYFVSTPETLLFWLAATDTNTVETNPLLKRFWEVVISVYRPNDSTNVIDFVGRLNEYFSSNVTDRLRQDFNTVDRFVLILQKALKCFDVNKLDAMDSEKEAVVEGLKLIADNRLWAIVVFENLDSNDTLPKHVKYKIRMDADRVDSTKRIEDRLPTPGARRRPFIDLRYLTFGFTYLQDLLEHVIIEEQTGAEALPGIWVQQFPYPCYISDQFILAISRTFPMFMTLSWVYSAAMLIKSIVYEKERRLKEVMKVMGLGNTVHWIGWFINSITLMVGTVALLTTVLKYGNILERSDPSLVFVFLICYSVATICKSFLISTFFSNANVAAAAGGIIFFTLYLPYPFMVMWEDELTGYEKIVASLLSNVAFGFGCNCLARFEESGTGLHWSNVDESPYVNNNFSMAKSMNMMIIDSVVYLVLTFYIENVFPGDYGVPKPWYYFVTYSYWCPNMKLATEVYNYDSNDFELQSRGTNCDFETEPEHVPCRIRIKNLRKVYSNGKVAISDLCLNFFEDQITSFLGHNGAGKTTTISILTGIFPPTSGSATIYGHDIRSDMDVIRRSLGTCPQYNVLFDHLTVEEHLWFYGRLKGALSDKQVKHEVQQMIRDVGLPEKRDQMITSLSGGMQRKVSVAVALVGGSQTVILDEPTAGVDPFSRRGIWELLLKYKRGRTIILTTHHMDEADLLGDRIAIISQGQLRCCGSSLFLKSRFGSGYRLTLVVDSSMEGISSCNVENVSTFVESHVPGSCLVRNVGSELVYTLPSDLKKNGCFERLLDALDRQLKILGISTYGISDSTLEEIFLKVTNGDENGVVANSQLPYDDGEIRPTRMKSIMSLFNRSDKKVSTVNNVDAGAKLQNQNTDHDHHRAAISNGFSPDSNPLYSTLPTRHPAKYVPATGWRLTFKQVCALYTKRLHHSLRNAKGLFCEIFLPVLFVCVTLAFTLIMPPYKLEPELELQPWLYGPPNNVFFSNENPSDPMAVRYERELMGDPGIGTRCMLGDPILKKPCLRALVPPVSSKNWLPNLESVRQSQTVSCNCDLGGQLCPASAGGRPPPSVTSVTGDFLLNVTMRNVSDWLVKTNKQYYKRRYGGFTFGYNNPVADLNVTNWHEIFDTLSRAAYNGRPLLEQSDYVFREFDRRMREDLPIFGNIKVWFDNRGWAAMVSYINALNNLILRSHLPSNRDAREYGITVVNHPLNFTHEQARDELIKRSGISLLHSICTIFAMSFVPASFVLYLIEDRVSKSQHLQFVTGVKPVVYWMANFVWDNLNYLISATLCIFVFLCFDAQAYVSSANFPGLALLLFFYGWASIPLMYPVSFFLDVPSTAFVVLSSGNLFLGVITTVSSYILEVIDDAALQSTGKIVKQVYLIFPHYCLGRGLLDMATNHLVAQSLAQFGVTFENDPLAWDFLGKNIFYMFVQGIVFFSFTLLLQYKFFNFCRFGHRFKSARSASLRNDRVDEDVAEETAKVLDSTMSPSSSLLRVVNLTKVYTNRRRKVFVADCCRRVKGVDTSDYEGREGRSRYSVAVNGLCFSINSGECFGLLGVNGAGKTTTFKMLTGDTTITSGDAFVNGHSVVRNMDRARRYIGYCPQFDALDPFLTGEEHLQFYARLRGIPEENVREVVRWQVAKMNLTAYTKRCAATYSAGNKRKLSTAIALVGNPAVVFMDEPTTGMDPEARRFLWSCITDLVKEGRSVILTSHSLEECETLCTRLAIMVDGRFQCLGSIQHLKSKFGDGYLLTIRVSAGCSSMDPVKQFVSSSFPDAVLEEEHHNQLVYQLKQMNGLSLLFHRMEEARERLRVEDYSVCQTTLDQVFINFAKKQTNVSNES